MILRSPVTRTVVAVLLAALTTIDWQTAAEQPQPLFLGSTNQLTTDPFSQTDPSISGSILVWTDQRNGNDDIYFCDLTDCAGTETQVTSASNAQRLNDVSGRLIAYSDVNGPTRAVQIFDIATGITTTVPGVSIDQNPRLGGQIVAFERGSASMVSVYAFDLATGTEIPVATTDALELNPVVDAGRVVYERHATGTAPGDIVLYDIATGQTIELEADTDDARRPDISGDLVVWDAHFGLGEVDVVIHNLVTGITTRVQQPGVQRSPHVSGDVVSFDDDSAGNPNVGLYHIPTGTYEIVTTSETSQFLNDISGNRVVFTSNLSGNLDIHVFEFQLQLPEIDVSPLSHDFGDVAVGSSRTTIVTISNTGPQPLTLTSIGMGSGSSAAFEIISGPAVPAVVPAAGTVDVGIRFGPSAIDAVSASLVIVSDDLDEDWVPVALTGRGVSDVPTPSEQIAELLAFFDGAVAGGTLRGDGSGNSAGGRLTALRNMIAGAGSLISRGLVAEACGQLLEAYRRVDGELQPPDFVTGPAGTELARLVQLIRSTLGCS